MYILSGYNKSFQYEEPISLSYLRLDDENAILSSVSQIKEIIDTLSLNDEYWYLSRAGVKQITRIDVVQTRGYSEYTIALLNRVRDAFASGKLYDQQDKANTLDLSLDMKQLLYRLEGNPDFIYRYVYNTFKTHQENEQSKGKGSRKERIIDNSIEKLTELYQIIMQSSGEYNLTPQDEQEDAKRIERLQLHSDFSYWHRMLLNDHIRYFDSFYYDKYNLPETQEDLIKTIRKDLKDLGIVGFVNPIQMYEEFKSSRVERKLGVQIDSDVKEFLRTTILSGGGKI